MISVEYTCSASTCNNPFRPDSKVSLKPIAISCAHANGNSAHIHKHQLKLIFSRYVQ